jgi:hypothetical protein
MIGPGFADGLNKALLGMVVIIAGVGYIVGAASAFWLPQLWGWFKPILQGWLA